MSHVILLFSDHVQIHTQQRWHFWIVVIKMMDELQSPVFQSGAMQCLTVRATSWKLNSWRGTTRAPDACSWADIWPSLRVNQRTSSSKIWLQVKCCIIVQRLDVGWLVVTWTCYIIYVSNTTFVMRCAFVMPTFCRDILLTFQAAIWLRRKFFWTPLT